jgi:hypothetical protein
MLFCNSKIKQNKEIDKLEASSKFVSFISLFIPPAHTLFAGMQNIKEDIERGLTQLEFNPMDMIANFTGGFPSVSMPVNPSSTANAVTQNGAVPEEETVAPATANAEVEQEDEFPGTSLKKVTVAGAEQIGLHQ